MDGYNSTFRVNSSGREAHEMRYSMKKTKFCLVKDFDLIAGSRGMSMGQWE